MSLHDRTSLHVRERNQFQFLDRDFSKVREIGLYKSEEDVCCPLNSIVSPIGR
jgi:hypothetical protein